MAKAKLFCVRNAAIALYLCISWWATDQLVQSLIQECPSLRKFLPIQYFMLWVLSFIKIYSTRTDIFTFTAIFSSLRDGVLCTQPWDRSQRMVCYVCRPETGLKKWFAVCTAPGQVSGNGVLCAQLRYRSQGMVCCVHSPETGLKQWSGVNEEFFIFIIPLLILFIHIIFILVKR